MRHHPLSWISDGTLALTVVGMQHMAQEKVIVEVVGPENAENDFFVLAADSMRDRASHGLGQLAMLGAFAWALKSASASAQAQASEQD